MSTKEHWYFKARGNKSTPVTKPKQSVKARDSHARYKASQSQASQQPASKQPTAEKALKQSEKQPKVKEQ